jgi:hypothetical protein
MPRKKLTPNERQLLQLIRDPAQSEAAILSAIDQIRRAPPRRRPGPALMNPLEIFLAIEKILESDEARKSWGKLTVDHITKAVQEFLRGQQLIASSARLRPYILWFLYFIVACEDRPPRLRYKVSTVKNPDYWHEADVARLDATRRLAAFPRHPRRVLKFTAAKWTRLTTEQRTQLLARKFLKEDPPLDLRYYSPELKNRLCLATWIWCTRAHHSLLSDWKILLKEEKVF